MGDYSSGDEASLPADTTNLDHVYDATDLSNVQTNDTNYVDQTGSAGYEIHQYKDSITAANASFTWIGKSSLAPSSSKVQLQVYNVTGTPTWENVSGAGASNNVAAADTDFTLSGTIATANYLDSGVTTFRVYQAASVAGNNFTGDSSCMAVWNVDNGALTTDGSPVGGGGGTNTLTNNSVTADTTNKKQGDAAALFNGSANLSIADASLNAGYPLKNGDSTLTGSVCAWLRPTTITASHDIYSKFYWDGGKGSLEIKVVDAGSSVYRFGVLWGYGGGAFEVFGPTDINITLSQWYHIGVTWDGLNKTDGLHIRIWDDTGTTVYDSLYTPTNNMVADTSPVVLGAQYTTNNNPFYGDIDEIVVFNRRLSSDDIDAIRQGTFGS